MEYFVTVEGVVSTVYRITAANEVAASREAQDNFKSEYKTDNAVAVRANKIGG
tara:strand:+ start:549 stop:707 length:159 start_codon:yes stop_codon:yes gene_type:complete